MPGGNYFVGIAPSSTKWLSKSVASLPPKCRILDPSDLHITVAFLGRIESSAIIDSLKQYIDNIPTFPIPHTYNLAEPHAYPQLSRMTAIGYKVGRNYNLIQDFIFVHRRKFYEIAAQNNDTHHFSRRIPTPHMTIARQPLDSEGAETMEYVKRKMREWVENQNGECHAPINDDLLFHEIALYCWSDHYPEMPLFQKVHTKSLIPSTMIHPHVSHRDDSNEMIVPSIQTCDGNAEKIANLI